MYKHLLKLAGPFFVTAFALVLYLLLRLYSQYDMNMDDPSGHFYIVTLASILAVIIAIIIGISGNKVRNNKVIFLSLAFISLAGVFLTHGLSTPGFILKSTNVPVITSQLSLSLTAMWLLCSSLSSNHPIVLLLTRWQRSLVPVWSCIVGIFLVATIRFPNIVNFIPVDRHPINWTITICTILLFLYTAQRYWSSYRYSNFPLQMSIIYSCGLLSVVQIIMTTGQIWMLSWWLYHFLMVIAMCIVIYGILRQYKTGSSIGTAIRSLFTTDPIERIEAGISLSVRALIIATEKRDIYTAGHNYRVALYALRIGEELGLPPEQLRAIAQGAVIHDVGKIEVPDHILNKPGKLTADERIIIEKHPVTGFEMCQRLGFMKEELEIIRSHHEKWDGTGYPDQLKGTQIPRLARIVAVADVYDALTSKRAYREPWSHEQAMMVIEDGIDTHFDKECVQAWVRVCKTKLPNEFYPSWVHESNCFNSTNKKVNI